MLLMWRSKRSCKQRQRHQFLFLVSCGEWQNTPSTETPDTAPLHSLFCFFYLLLGRKGHLPHKRFTLSHSTFCNLLQRWKGKGKKCPHRTFLYHTDILFIYANGLCGIRWDLCVPFLSLTLMTILTLQCCNYDNALTFFLFFCFSSTF